MREALRSTAGLHWCDWFVRTLHGLSEQRRSCIPSLPLPQPATVGPCVRSSTGSPDTLRFELKSAP